MREGIDPHRPIGAPHDHRSAGAVFSALDRVGERLAFELRGIREHIGDGFAFQFRVVERKDDVRQQHTIALSLDRSARPVEIHPGAGGEPA